MKKSSKYLISKVENGLMISTENQTYQHAIHDSILFEPTLQSDSSNEPVLYDRIGLKPRPNDLCDHFSGRLLCLFTQDYLYLFKELLFAELSELIKVEVLGHKVHDDLFGL